MLTHEVSQPLVAPAQACQGEILEVPEQVLPRLARAGPFAEMAFGADPRASQRRLRQMPSVTVRQLIRRRRGRVIGAIECPRPRPSPSPFKVRAVIAAIPLTLGGGP